MISGALVVAVAATVTCASPALDVRLEPPGRTGPAYRLSLSNRSTHSVLAIQYDVFRGGVRVLSARRKTDRNEALVAPGRGHAFEIGTWASVDRIAVTSVLWDDGRVEGDPGLLADERMIDIGKAAQIRSVLHLIREAAVRDADSSGLRAGVIALPTSADLLRATATKAGMQQVKDAVLKDLDAFEQSSSQRGAASFATWLADATASYEEWLARIVAR
jgi:hypothetical protein